jgi:hypothetical protein
MGHPAAGSPELYAYPLDRGDRRESIVLMDDPDIKQSWVKTPDKKEG